jgi:hypothetical protein
MNTWRDVDLMKPVQHLPILVWIESDHRYLVIRWSDEWGWMSNDRVLGPNFKFDFWQFLSPPGAPNRYDDDLESSPRAGTLREIC